MSPINHVAVVNRSNGFYPDRLLQLAVEAYRAALPAFCEAWGLPEPGLAVYPSDSAQRPTEAAALFLVDGAGDPDAYGAHTALGLEVWGYVDVVLCARFGEPIERVLGHELFELLADPMLDRWVGDYAVEVCDPVQRGSRPAPAEFFGASGQVQVANYVLPSWYAPGALGPFDRDGTVGAPLEVAPGGYQITRAGSSRAAVGAARVTSFGRTLRRLAR